MFFLFSIPPTPMIQTCFSEIETKRCEALVLIDVCFSCLPGASGRFRDVDRVLLCALSVVMPHTGSALTHCNLLMFSLELELHTLFQEIPFTSENDPWVLYVILLHTLLLH